MSEIALRQEPRPRGRLVFAFSVNGAVVHSFYVTYQGKRYHKVSPRWLWPDGKWFLQV